MSTENGNGKATVTYEKILNFRNWQGQYCQSHAQQFRPFLYALTKMNTKLAKHEDDYNDKMRLLNLTYAGKDDKGYAIMEKFNVEKRGEKKEEERFKFKLDDQKKLNEEQRKLLNETVEVDVHHTTDIPDDLDFQWWNVFAPFVLPEDPSEEQLAELYKRTEEKLEKSKPKAAG